jgi:hypothetical protein
MLLKRRGNTASFAQHKINIAHCLACPSTPIIPVAEPTDQQNPGSIGCLAEAERLFPDQRAKWLELVRGFIVGFDLTT